MLVQEEKVNTKEFLIEFSKRFSNFCQKAPLILSFRTTPKGVVVFNHSTQKSTEFEFDFTKNVKENIHTIKDYLLEHEYPILLEVNVDYVDYSSKEIQESIDSGQNPDNVLLSKKEVLHSTKWRIERVIVRRDELFVRNLRSNELFRYKFTKMPCTLFLKRYREKMDPAKAWETFVSKVELIGKVEEVEN